MEFKRWRPASGYRLSFFDHPEFLKYIDTGIKLPGWIIDMSTKKILVVDDSLSQLKLMKKVLEKLGHMTVTVDSAEEAEYLLRCGEHFSLIITDLRMPWLNGLNFCRRVKILNPDLKIYALSGYLYNFDMNELEDAGFDGIYQKPISKSNLEEILNAGI
jgi:CheY-like chemotaxis protein